MSSTVDVLLAFMITGLIYILVISDIIFSPQKILLIVHMAAKMWLKIENAIHNYLPFTLFLKDIYNQFSIFPFKFCIGL